MIASKPTPQPKVHLEPAPEPTPTTEPTKELPQFSFIRPPNEPFAGLTGAQAARLANTLGIKADVLLDAMGAVGIAPREEISRVKAGLEL